MSKMIVLALTLLCSAAWLQAQDTSSQSPSGAPQTGNASSRTTVEGCLQGSDGNFTLTDNNGTTYQLQGDSAKLGKHVGHEVQVTGSASSSSSPSATGGGMSGGGSQPTLTVDKMKHIATSCKTASK